MFTSIEEALDWVMKRKRTDTSFEDHVRNMKDLGDPQDDFPMIHVAGTNGKGSTVAYLRDLLMSQGYKVGTLQSPHYETHLDRIRINGENIPGDVFMEILNEYYDFIIDRNIPMFEIDYIIMCEWFKREKVDIAVIEVGMGGRLDSTNVVHHPLLSVITTIGYDHMESLGDTLEKICIEKCGIIKEDSAVLVGKLDETLKDVVKEIAEERYCSYHETEETVEVRERTFLYKGETYEITSYAKYQYDNAATALEAFFLVMEGRDIDLEKAKEALKNTIWKGRFEVISKDPFILYDGAHNIHGVAALTRSLDALKGRKLIIFSALRRKDYRTMIEALRGHGDLIITSFDYPGSIREKDVEDLGVIYVKDHEEIRKRYPDYDVILYCGSLYFLSELATEKKP